MSAGRTIGHPIHPAGGGGRRARWPDRARRTHARPGGPGHRGAAGGSVPGAARRPLPRARGVARRRPAPSAAGAAHGDPGPAGRRHLHRRRPALRGLRGPPCAPLGRAEPGCQRVHPPGGKARQPDHRRRVRRRRRPGRPGRRHAGAELSAGQPFRMGRQRHVGRGGHHRRRRPGAVAQDRPAGRRLGGGRPGGAQLGRGRARRRPAHRRDPLVDAAPGARVHRRGPARSAASRAGWSR